MNEEIKQLEEQYENIVYPPNFFEGWDEQKFKFWLKLDEYGNVMNHPTEENVLAVLNAVEPFEELGYLQDICLQELITLKKLNLINIKN